MRFHFDIYLYSTSVTFFLFMYSIFWYGKMYAMTSAVAFNYEPIYQDTKMVLSDEPVNSKLAASSSF